MIPDSTAINEGTAVAGERSKSVGYLTKCYATAREFYARKIIVGFFFAQSLGPLSSRKIATEYYRN